MYFPHSWLCPRFTGDTQIAVSLTQLNTSSSSCQIIGRGTYYSFSFTGKEYFLLKFGSWYEPESQVALKTLVLVIYCWDQDYNIIVYQFDDVT
jgi:hypothetical protein